MGKVKIIVASVLAVAVLGLAAASFAGAAREGSEYSEATGEYEGLADSFVKIEKIEMPNKQGTLPTDSDKTPKEPRKSQIPLVVDIDFDALEQKNPSFAGWLYYEPAGVSLPVVYDTPDATRYYLTHTFEGEENSSGCLFFDRKCQRGFGSFNTIVYGHHMKNGSMFGEFTSLSEEDVLANQTAYFFSKEKSYAFKVVAVYNTSATSETYDLAFGGTPEERASYAEYISKITSPIFRDDAFFDSHTYEEIAKGRFLTMSTCYKHNSGLRTVVQAILTTVEER